MTTNDNLRCKIHAKLDINSLLSVFAMFPDMDTHIFCFLVCAIQNILMIPDDTSMLLKVDFYAYSRESVTFYNFINTFLDNLSPKSYFHFL